MPEEKIIKTPRVSGFKIDAKRKKGIEGIFNALSSLTFLELAKEGDDLIAINIESRDIQKNPYLFSIGYFKENKIELLYTYVPGMSPKKRRLDVLRYFLNILSLVEQYYEINNRQIYQLVEAAISDMSEYVTSDYNKLYSEYDNLKTELAALQKKVKSLSETNEALSRENYELKAKNDEYLLRLKELETYSDDVLAAKVQEWIREHRGEINISEFSRVHKVPETRVEQMLNKLVMEGYLEARR